MGYTLTRSEFDQVLEGLSEKYRLYAPVLKKGQGREYCGAAEPPARWWRSHLSGLLEPPRLSTGYLAFSGSNP